PNFKSPSTGELNERFSNLRGSASRSIQRVEDDGPQPRGQTQRPRRAKCLHHILTNIAFISTPQLPSVRSSEILKYNSTIHNVNGSRVFTYYWTVHDIVYRMKNWPWRRSLRSKSFYIFQFGYRMYMRIYPNQNGKNIYMHVGITQGAYDDSLEWPFKLKHKIQVLDHDTPGEDLFSRVWDPKELCSGWNWRKPDPLGDNYECVGLGFPQDTIYSRNYLHNNSITVKLTVFLDV
ncbi:TNF receptor-associated factor 4, partial [Armadillidium vulgare]